MALPSAFGVSLFPGRKRPGFFFSFQHVDSLRGCFQRRIPQRFLADCGWSLYRSFEKMQRRKAPVAMLLAAGRTLPNDFQKETLMQKSRRLFFAFAAATALGATTLLTGCHHWGHRPPPPRGGRPSGGPSGSGGPGGSGRPGPGSDGPGGPGAGPGGRPGPR